METKEITKEKLKELSKEELKKIDKEFQRCMKLIGNAMKEKFQR